MATAKRKRRSWQEYNVAWISALPIERASASEMLDEVHEEPEDFVRNGTDNNSYTWGLMHEHNIVIASLPSHSYGKVNAAHTVVELLASLPHIKFGLLVGIGAGLPSDQHDIRLGDVVVSQPNGSDGGVVQYDLGKATADGSWERVGCLNAPPAVLLRALSRLQAEHESGRFLMAEYLSRATKRNEYWGARFSFPLGKADRLFRSQRVMNDQPMEFHIVEEEVKRIPRASTEPCIHYGTILSGDILVKNTQTRDDIQEKIRQTCLCLEMEAAGLMQKFPCIVVRGISDYADPHKNDEWQRYASATAAAFAKELLFYTPVVEVGRSRNATDIMDFREAVTLLHETLASTQKDSNAQKVSNFLQSLHTCPYADRKDRNIEALDDTCQWFIQHPRFTNWLQNPSARLLWVSADPGCGKSVLTRYLVDKVLGVDEDKIVCYFFFKDDFADQNRGTFAMSAILRQLFIQRPALLSESILKNYVFDGDKYVESFRNLWDDFVKAISSDFFERVICIFDALDECRKDDRKMLVTAITNWHWQNPEAQIKFLVTSRPYLDIRDEFHGLVAQYPTIHLSGESDEEVGKISKEIDIVIRYRIQSLCQKRSLNSQEESVLVHKFMEIPHRTYLWAHLTMELVESAPALTMASIKDMLANLPKSVEEAYERILDRSLDPKKTRLLLHLLLAAQRPLSVAEMSLAVSLTAEQTDSSEFEDNVEPAERFKYSIRDLCGLFVVVVDHHVYLLHQTAREFLLGAPAPSDSVILQNDNVLSPSAWTKSFNLSESHGALAERCLWFLFTASSSAYDPIFFDYCYKFWYLHFTKADFEPNSPQVLMAWSIFNSWSTSYSQLPSTIRNMLDIDSNLMVLQYKASIPTAVLSACFGCVSVLRTMLSHQIGLNNITDVLSAIEFAAQAGHTGVVEFLVPHALNMNTEVGISFPFSTSLWKALLWNRKATLKVLLEHNLKFDPDSDDIPLHVVSGSSHQGSGRETIELLLQHGADPAGRNESGALPIHSFLEHQHGLCSDPLESLKILKLLLVPNTDINESCHIAGGNLFKFAALGTCTICMESLKKLGASPDLQDSFGNTTLHYIACSQGDPSCVRFALRSGIAIDCRNSEGQTPLMIATMFGRLSLARELLTLGANASELDNSGRTPLMFAVISRLWWTYFGEIDEERHRDFLSKTAPFIQTYLQYSFESISSTSSRIQMIDLLLQHNADVNAKDARSPGLIHLAVYKRRRAQLKRFLNAGADTNQVDVYGRTPLMVLGTLRPDRWDRHYTRNTWKLLLRYGADPNIRDVLGRTASWYRDNSEQTRLLEERQWRVMIIGYDSSPELSKDDMYSSESDDSVTSSESEA